MHYKEKQITRCDVGVQTPLHCCISFFASAPITEPQSSKIKLLANFKISNGKLKEIQFRLDAIKNVNPETEIGSLFHNHNQFIPHGTSLPSILLVDPVCSNAEGGVAADVRVAREELLHVRTKLSRNSTGVQGPISGDNGS